MGVQKSGTSEGGKDGATGGDAGDDVKDTTNAAGQQDGGEANGSDEADAPDESGWDAKTAAYIKKLRGEAAGNRTKAKDLQSQLKAQSEKEKKLKAALGVESDDEDPEEKLKASQAEKEALNFRVAVLEMATEHGIGKEGLEYFEFLVTKKAGSLEEGEELSDEVMDGIIKEVKAKHSKGAANSSVGNKGSNGGGSTPDPKDNDGMTLEKFVKMNVSEKSAYYQKNKTHAEELMKEARRTNRLI